MKPFVDSAARCEAEAIGCGSRVAAYARVSADVTIGRNCAIQEHAIVLGRVVLRDDVEVEAGVQLFGPVTVEEGVVIGAGAVVGWRRSKDDASSGSEIVVHRGASIGANVTVRPGVSIGRGAIVESGAVVKDNVPANAVVTGNPATIVAYVDGEYQGEAEVVVPPSVGEGVTNTRVRGVTVHPLTYARDLRGSLTAAEFVGLPFSPQRLFMVYDVPSESVRGSHAHRVCSQFVVCISGTVSCLVDDGSAREEVRLENPSLGLHIPPMIWGTQWRYTRDAILLVLASHPYDAADYIRDYEEFLEELERTR